MAFGSMRDLKYNVALKVNIEITPSRPAAGLPLDKGSTLCRKD